MRRLPTFLALLAASAVTLVALESGPAPAVAATPACSLTPVPTRPGDPDAPVGTVVGTGEGPAVRKVLRSNGTWLLDRAGRVVILHGTNQIRKLPPYTPSSIGFGADDVEKMREAGFNSVRLGVIWKAFEPTPGHYDRRYLADLAGTVKLFTDRKMSVIFDFHQDMYNEAFSGQGFPDWATDPGPLPIGPDCGFPSNYFAQLAQQHAWDQFWGNRITDSTGRSVHQAFVAMWKQVARQFRDDPYVVGYDIFNEPFPGSSWLLCANPLGGCPADAQLRSLQRKVISGIRQVDPNTTVFYEPWVTFNFGAATGIGDMQAENVGMAFHNYCIATVVPVQLALTGLVCDGVGEPLPFIHASARAARGLGAPLMTEFGATQDLDVLNRIANRADEHLTGWQHWAWFNEDPSAERPNEGIVKDPALPPTGDNLNREVLAALTRAYPRAIAGTPESFGFDPATGEFALTYRTRRADGTGSFPGGSRTLVRVPAGAYPDGYAVEVTGATVQRRGQDLVVTSTSGARVVTLRLIRR